MLWFLKDKDKKKRRRRRSVSSSQRGSERWDSADRKLRSKRRPRRSTRGEQRETKREDTRDRDDLRKERQRDRTVAKEQEGIFSAINYDDAPIEIDEVDRTFGRVLTISLYVLLGLLVTGIVVYAVSQGISSRQAARVKPLLDAAYAGDLDTVRAVVAEDVSVDGIGPGGGTALGSAIRGGQPEAARLLLELGAEPTDEAIRLAMRYDRWDILGALIEAGGNPDVRGVWSGRSPLERAVERQDMETVRLLLANGADAGAVSLEGPFSRPALHYAAEHGMREYVELLLEYGADPRKRWMGFSPPELAEDSGHDGLARLLAQAEAAMGAAGMMDEQQAP